MVTGSSFTKTTRLPYMLPPILFYHVVFSPATRGKVMEVTNVVFKDFNTRTCLGNRLKALTLHASSSDLIMHHIFKDITLDNVPEPGLFYL